jgi:hypothetical protein
MMALTAALQLLPVPLLQGGGATVDTVRYQVRPVVPFYLSGLQTILNTYCCLLNSLLTSLEALLTMPCPRPSLQTRPADHPPDAHAGADLPDPGQGADRGRQALPAHQDKPAQHAGSHKSVCFCDVTRPTCHAAKLSSVTCH